MDIVENAATCTQCGQWHDIEDMLFEWGDYYCYECHEL
jgi:late competence protein required for DNA uptake (superfamily II DNA/RNA helicase)